MAPITLSKLRHEVRTLLNHIVGYADILLEDISAQRNSEFYALFGELRDLALSLREPFSQLLSGKSQGAEESVDTEALKHSLYGLLYDIIALVQTIKRRCTSKETKPYLRDLQKILESSNGMVDIFEGFLADSPYLEVKDEEREDGVKTDDTAVHLTGNVLVVDDDAINRELLIRHLERQGHTVFQAANGALALEILQKTPVDIVLMDVMMPEMNGYQFLERIKASPSLRDIHVIVISALEESGSVARCLRLGAEDYLPREFDPIVLRARIESCLERKRLRAREELSLRAVAQTQRRLAAELRRAADYVRSLLPQRVWWKALRTDWVFLPSLDLGGDAFGYSRLENGDITLYLLDVSGHGVEAALLSVSLLNQIQTQFHTSPDLWDPAKVLSEFNRFYRSEEHNNLYFSAWFGLWNPETHILRFSSAGSPPAVLISEESDLRELCSDSPAVGVDDEAVYSDAEVKVPAKARLFLFSDGIFEAGRPDKHILGLPSFLEIVKAAARGDTTGNLTRIVEAVRGVCGRTQFDDDVSMVGFYFDA
jgi:phosphoserine phosphatase RsbU/P